ncbi:hypothetical protein TEA_007812 [Camellia sinensis var. sinensis]|uniref:Shikimate dehydrogenase substrate binding N-terminal domain-containing protein n=1 Tax=Camellia sinensis var. sinensis TaxID=542762 RepID=A0A4S4EQ87_CAMSN|nr:hypothetical protein TEA_007812 [Camellia sinensis var. sinensis]
MGSVGVLTNSTMICAPLMSQSVEQMVSDMNQAKAQGADVVEIRLDCIKDFQPSRDLQILLNNKPLPVLIVYRPQWEGGQYGGDENMRLDTLRLAKELGADYIDLELKVASHLMEEHNPNKRRSSKIIVSRYIDGTTPSEEDLSQLVAHMQSTGADIIKLVSKSSSITELPRFFHLLSHCQIPLITYSIGDRGLISQLLGPKFDGFLIYGSIEGNPVPGLPTLHNLRHAYGVDYLNAETKVFGLISKPVGHSKGPLLHNPTFRHVGYNGIYVPMLVDDLEEFFSVYSSPDYAGFRKGKFVKGVDQMRPDWNPKTLIEFTTTVGDYVAWQLSVRDQRGNLPEKDIRGTYGVPKDVSKGTSVGFPYKETVTAFCDEVDPLAQSIGAVNTIIRRHSDGKLVGYNTDCEASITAIEDDLKVWGCTNGEVLLPSPLTGKMFVLVGAGGAGRALAFGAKSRGFLQILEDKGTLGDYKVVFDAVYMPRKTTLLKEAEAAGAIIVSGVEMFLRQAIEQFNLFTGGKGNFNFFPLSLQVFLVYRLGLQLNPPGFMGTFDLKGKRRNK